MLSTGLFKEIVENSDHICTLKAATTNKNNSICITFDDGLIDLYEIASMMLFQQHMKHIIKQDETVYDISFRQKEKGWSSKYLYFRTNKRINFKPYMYDSFYAGFLKDNVLLRRSCYECQYRQSHVADITLADFWGYREYDESIFTEKGVSLMITNTELGEKIMNDVAQVAQVYKIDNHYSDYVYKNKDYLGARSLTSFKYSGCLLEDVPRLCLGITPIC